MNPIVKKIKRRITRLSNSSCMYDKNTSFIDAYERIYNQINNARIRRPDTKEALLNSLYAIRANSSLRLHRQLCKKDNSKYPLTSSKK